MLNQHSEDWYQEKMLSPQQMWNEIQAASAAGTYDTQVIIQPRYLTLGEDNEKDIKVSRERDLVANKELYMAKKD